jgi:hypothetical protein
MPITFAGNSTPSDVIRQSVADTRYISPNFWNVVPLNAGWTSTSFGTGTSLTQNALTLSLQSANTSGLFGGITAYVNQGGENAFRLGTGNGAGGYATLNFANKLYFSIRMGSIFNFSNTKTDWAFTVGSQSKNVAPLSAVLPDPPATDVAYFAMECLSGNLRLVTQQGTNNPAQRSGIVDTWSSGQNHKSYIVELVAGTIKLYSGFTGSLLGSLSGGPTSATYTPQSQSIIAFASQNNAGATTTTDRINIYSFAMGFIA